MAYDPIRQFKGYLDFAGKVGLFAVRVARRAVVPPFEWMLTWERIEEVGWKSLPLVLASGLALGVVLTLHTRSSLVRFGAESMIPTFQAVAFFTEIGPLVVGLLVAGRVGSGIGAVLADMRATEQIDAIDAISIDSFRVLVVPNIVACIVSLPLLTVFMDAAGLLGGYLAEQSHSHLSVVLYLHRAFSQISWAGFIPPTLKTSVFGLIIGVISCYFGYTTNEGSIGVGRASTNSVVLSSFLIIISDVTLVKLIFFLFPGIAS